MTPPGRGGWRPTDGRSSDPAGHHLTPDSARARRIRVAIIGCGAIAVVQHVPVILKSADAELAFLVDANVRRTRELKDMFRLSCRTASDFREALPEIDAAVLATPIALHAPQAIACLDAGVHVFCEKPMAGTPEECRRMADAADRNSRVLAVGHIQRFFPSTRTLKTLLEEQVLGDLLRVHMERGVRFQWDTASGFYFDRALSGGGVVLDAGCHSLDRLIYWFGEPEVLSYEDDCLGGVEANAVLRLRVQYRGRPVDTTAIFSRTHPLPHQICVAGTEGIARISDDTPDIVTLERRLGRTAVSYDIRPSALDGQELGGVQWADFIRSVRTGSRPVCGGKDAIAVVSLIRRCYERAERLSTPWVTYHSTLSLVA